MAFSGALTLTDLNDFITPGQACIKPVEQKKEERDVGAALTEISIDSNGGYYEVTAGEKSKNKKLEQAQISLNDCLACSGCITSAESVLITMQSHTEVLEVLAANEVAEDKKIAVVSIAPQSLASLAASLGDDITPRQVLRRLRPFLHSLGFAYVFDTNYGRELALREHVKEFEERKEAADGGEEGQLPMLASACPGWICYAEKTHHEMLAYIARTKSPQQVMGTLVKGWMAEKWGKRRDGVYHVTVMPCYDKKLEASRTDFYSEEYRTRDVDCVITTGELEVMLREKGWDMSVAVPGELDGGRMVDGLPELVRHKGTSSGSYLHWIMGSVLRQVAGGTVEVKTMRNADYEEYTIRDGERVVFRGATCYGFRNLQNIVRKVGKEQGVRTGTGAAGRLGGVRRRTGEVEKKYDYVEVMACPGGCVNGGGQLKGPGKEWTRRVEAAYWRDGEGEGEVEVIEGLELRTEYRGVESEVVGLAVKW
uniref:Cytosolic Fe-S cluster assembly factor NAR1 n=1 Tax=Psilocybe cubensis TaxID=181762 RepID=A0A8H7Y3A8_PSICU